ncbi:flavin-containing monooxygenase [Desertimonas flava]|uniref:flavin-containing monooxygenase n=1 Tax=Desertimonas flava TaxID=2064846 RepID=UPI000E3527EA|nr:NAD(P)/FAD-dependent oxidoreductase [Desertimonas flava]
MTLARPIEPITASDGELRDALEVADLPALLPALAHVTGDLGLLREELRVDATLMGEDQGGLTPEQQGAIRALALETLIAFRDGGSVAAPMPTGPDLRVILQFMAGGLDIDDYLPMMREELALDSDLRAPHWHKDDVAPDRPFEVVVIGAGMSGIVAAYRLAEAGVSYVVLDKNADVGGTWLENSYPGCRVDIPNHYYSYSFAQRADWPLYYSPRSELYAYFRRCVDEFGIRPNIRFDTEVSSVEYDDATARWTVCTVDADGNERTIEADAVISAVGQLNRPQLPQIEGRESFAGPAFHSARWDHDVDLSGKRVGVIGTGCSAAQFAPLVAEEVGHLEIFQRTPNWQFPVPHYRHEVPQGFQYLLQHVPYYRQWYRFWLFWKSAELLRPMAEVDPEWPDMSTSVGEGNDLLRQMLTEAMLPQYEDRPDLIPKVIPQYPPASKRIIVDDGSWAEMLHRDNVTLTTTGIDRIVPEGVVTVDGELHEFDVLLYGTGFQPSKFLTPMKVVGRGGVELHERWAGDARAYLGVTVPGFPNFFMLYGPNTNIVVNGSIIWFSECEVRYVMDCIRHVLAGRHRALDVREEVHDRFNEEVDAENLRMAWGVSTVNSWYKSDSGRVAQNWPFPLLDYWTRTREVDPSEYELL